MRRHQLPSSPPSRFVGCLAVRSCLQLGPYSSAGRASLSAFTISQMSLEADLPAWSRPHWFGASIQRDRGLIDLSRASSDNTPRPRSLPLHEPLSVAIDVLMKWGASLPRVISVRCRLPRRRPELAPSSLGCE